MTSDDRTQVALRSALEARDDANPAPAFRLRATPRAPAGHLPWRPILACVASAAVVAIGLLWWAGIQKPHGIDARLAKELSSSSYWSVPTDQLLAYEPAPMSFDLPVPGLNVSLEESVL